MCAHIAKTRTGWGRTRARSHRTMSVSAAAAAAMCEKSMVLRELSSHADGRERFACSLCNRATDDRSLHAQPHTHTQINISVYSNRARCFKTARQEYRYRCEFCMLFSDTRQHACKCVLRALCLGSFQGICFANVGYMEALPPVQFISDRQRCSGCRNGCGSMWGPTSPSFTRRDRVHARSTYNNI